MRDPFRDPEVAVASRITQVLDEIATLRARLEAYEGLNRSAVVAGQLEQLRARVDHLRGEREDLRAELTYVQLAREGKER